MHAPKIQKILMFLLLWVILGIPTGAAHYDSSVTIASTGTISTQGTDIVYSSEIRGVFIHESIYAYDHNWTLIAQTLHQYGINAVFVGDGGRPDTDTAIAAFHAYGIQYHNVMQVLMEWPGDASTWAISYDGSVPSTYGHCPIRSHDVLVKAVQDYLSRYNVDGIMYDYLRYQSQDTCYCPSCRAAFQAWLGEGPITNWAAFYPGGSRWLDYAEWRTIPVDALARDLRQAALAINPNLKISQAAWTLFSDSPTYWRKFLGQDSAQWIKDDVLDFIAPMMYTQTIYGATGETLESCITTEQQYRTAGVEGKIPLLAFLKDDYGGINPTPTEFKAEVDYVRSRGLDGWIIWRYGGPGDAEPTPDITQYLAALSLPPTFTISNIQSAAGKNSATISWFTDRSTLSRVEYSITPLFNATFRAKGGFNYWDIDHNQGIIIEDTTVVMNHIITVTGLLPSTDYYFRVQSQDPSGEATSRVMTFSTTS